MRHRKSGRQLGRTSSHRQAMFKNMVCSLFEHELIKTTLPRAKELRRFAEPLITLAKLDSVANRRQAFAQMGSKAAVGKLFDDLGARYQERPGGYTRILKCDHRAGDTAPMALVELLDRKLLPDEAPGALDTGPSGTETKSLPDVRDKTPQAKKPEGWLKRLQSRFRRK